MKKEILIKEATFNPKVKTYIFFVVLFFLITSLIGIPLIPFWILGLGQWLSGKFFKTLSCQITNKNLKFSKGLILHIEKTIPLENIQDLSFVGGPILRFFGLTLIKIETAGGGGGNHQNLMSMLGINDAENFKIEILNQRELVIYDKNQNNKQEVTLGNQGQLSNDILLEIKNELVKLNQALAK